MAKYIDENLLIEKMSRLRGCSCSYSDGIIDEIEDIMSDIPTADVVGREKIDKAIKKIKAIKRLAKLDMNERYEQGLKCALDILQKHIEGSEE